MSGHDVPAQFPLPLDDDPEDVSWALSTAEALWKRGERADAITWIRRAAEAAGEAEADDRVLALARAAADLTAMLAANHAPPAPIAEPARPAPLLHNPFLDPPEPAPVAVEPAGIEIELDDVALEPTSDPRPAPPVAAAKPHKPPPKPGSKASEGSFIPTPNAFPSPLLALSAAELAAVVAEQEAAPERPFDDPFLDGRREGDRDSHPRVPTIPPEPPDFHPTPMALRAAPEAVAPPTSAGANEDDDDVVTSAPPLPSLDAIEQTPMLGEAVLAMVSENSVKTIDPPPRPRAEGAPPRPIARALGQHLTPVDASFGEAKAPPTRQPQIASATIEAAAPPAGAPEPPRPSRSVPPPRPTLPSQPPPRLELSPIEGIAIPSAPKVPSVGGPPRPAPKSPSVAPPPPAPPPEAFVPAPAAAAPSLPPPSSAAQSSPPAPEDLSTVEALADVPEDERNAFARLGTLMTLAPEQDVEAPPLIVVLRGEVEVRTPGFLTTIDAITKSQARLLSPRPPAEGSFRLHAGFKGASFLAFDLDAVATLRTAAPWVLDEFEQGSDDLHVMAGAVRGPLGERLDGSMLSLVLDRAETMRLAPHATVVKHGEPVRALVVCGGGSLSLRVADAPDAMEIGSIEPGEILYPSELLARQPAPSTVRAGERGALVLVATRQSTAELLATVPPLVELLGEG